MSGGKGGSQTVGYRYKLAYHAGLGVGPIDAFLEFRGGTKTAWSGRLTASGTITINQPNLWGGDKDQGGIRGDVHLMFGESTQQPSAYLASVFGYQQPAWRGMASLVFAGGLYGSLNPYPQAASYKIQRILRGWFDGVADAWYPEKAEVLLGDWTPGTTQIETEYSGGPHFPSEFPIDFGNVGGDVVLKYITGNIPDKITIEFDGVEVLNTGYVGNTNQQAGLNAALAAHGLLPETIVMFNPAWAGTLNLDTDPGVMSATFFKSSLQREGIVRVWAPMDETGWIFRLTMPASGPAGGVYGINLAHALYYARTHALIGREPAESMNDASWRAAADWYHAQGFGICVEFDPSSESLSDYEARICKLGGCSITRSLVDGQLYIDIANGEYDLDGLPILTDDDILDFSEQPTVLDSAVNSLQVKYFDPSIKEDVITAPVQVLGLIDAFGTISQTNEYQEIPDASLALRVAERDVRAGATPTRAFDLICTRKPRDWRPNTYFRLQAPKRGIADMVCIVGSNESGTLKSGAIKLTTTQDIYSLPATTFVEQEPGVDTRPDQTAQPITLQRAFEAPYIVVCTTLDRANLDLLPADVGYLQAVAADPASSRDYTLVTADAGGTYVETVHGDWCPTATINEPAGYLDATFTLADGVGLVDVATATAALLGDEIVRVDAIDIATGTLTVGRGCADTVAQAHAAGERIWFVGGGDVASDTTEYIDGETLAVKLLTNTGSEQLAEASATAMSVEMAGRQARPYPPAAPTLNGEAWPAEIFEMADVAWVHRDRKAQADQLIDQTMASIGPEAGTTYTVRWYLGGTLFNTASGIAGTSASYAPPTDGALRIEIESVRDGLTSLQMQVIECSYRVSPYADYLDHAGTLYADQAGTTYQG